jgi:diguanylate cyclase (GGDEF)-like protein
LSERLRENSSGSKILDEDQALSDRDQTLADADQTVADGEQVSADRDQAADDDDQANADLDQAARDRGVVPDGESRKADDAYDRRTKLRLEKSQGRFQAAAARDEVARARDLAALARDRVAVLRDRQMTQHDADLSEAATAAVGEDVIARREDNRRRAAESRASAAESRAQAAMDRALAAEDRAEAQADRDELLEHLTISETDALTGARTRGAGLAELDQEIDRARRTTGQLAVGYVDVVGLKKINDEQGHAAGDAVLQRVVTAMRVQLRSYDLIVRLGGDEFLCVISGATIDEARRRLKAIQATLAADPDPRDIKVGIATLSPDDTARELVQRADAKSPTAPYARNQLLILGPEAGVIKLPPRRSPRSACRHRQRASQIGCGGQYPSPESRAAKRAEVRST